mmetsp:Transcript_21267/g.67324  ORF Transcript_21267/g.67324 Transcript_21267/m.67324 type:complete len:117 (+) Transcript_21267:399-749(+)
MTTMRCAFCTVLRRCATTSTVLSRIMRSIASCTTASLSASRAEVASSRSRIRGLRTRARAMAMRCFCPPLSCTPFSPHSVSYPSGMAMMKSWALASFAAPSTSSCVGSGTSPSSRP